MAQLGGCPPPGGVLLGILGVSVPPGSPNPDPIQDQKMSFFTQSLCPFSDQNGAKPYPLGRHIPIYGLHLTVIPRARMGSESIAHSAFSLMGY